MKIYLNPDNNYVKIYKMTCFSTSMLDIKGGSTLDISPSAEAALWLNLRGKIITVKSS